MLKIASGKILNISVSNDGLGSRKEILFFSYKNQMLYTQNDINSVHDRQISFRKGKKK